MSADNELKSSLHQKSPGLLNLTINALKITTILTSIKMLVDFAAQVVIARIISAEVFGVVAIALAFSGFVSLIADWGSQRWIIQKKDLSREDVSSAFTFEISIAFSAALIWHLFSDKTLTFFGKSEAAEYCAALSLWIITERLQMPKAILEREMNFKASNIAAFFGIVLGSAAAIALALNGFGGFAIIYGMIARSVTTAVFLWLFSPIKPSLRITTESLKQFLPFGFPLALSGLMVYFYGNIDYVIVGKVLTDTALGYYFIAYKFPHYLHQLQIIITSVTFPAFSKTQSDEQLKRGFVLATKYSAVFALPALTFSLIFGKEIIKFLLGEKWLPAVIPFKLFMCLAALRMITVYWYDVYVSKGLTGAVAVLTAINCAAIPAFAYFGAKAWGIEGAAAGVTLAASATIIIATQYYLKKILTVSYLEILRLPIILNAALFLLLIAIKFLLKDFRSSYHFWGMMALTGAVYVSAFYLFDKKELMNIKNNISR